MSRNVLFVLYLIFSIAVFTFIGTGGIFVYASSEPRAADPAIRNSANNSPDIYEPEIIRSYPHDPEAFTQGIVFYRGHFYEGTGLYGKSSLRKTVLETGDVMQRIDLPSQLFGEGITVVKNALIQLTWRSRIGFVYDRESFELIRIFQYATEGWGITYDGRNLIMSDGSERLYFINPESFKTEGKVSVHDGDNFITKLNELEFIKGMIYANVWQTDHIAIIDPATGQVKGWIELEELVRAAGGDDTMKTLNGIAYDGKNDRLFVTGKMWPSIYEIRLVPSVD